MGINRWLRFDWASMVAIFALCAIGSVEIHYATYAAGPGTFRSHLLRIGIGLFLFLAASFVPYRKVFSIVYFAYAGAMLVLVMVLLFGKVIHSSKSWIGFGGMVFQPSETVKLVLILTLAKFLADYAETYLGLATFLKLSALAIVPYGLIFLQHDLGTAITLIPLTTAVCLLAGVRRNVVLLVLFVGLFGALASWHGLQPYQKERIQSVIDPERDPQRIGYQTNQSIIAHGSGGLTGKGLGKGSQGAMGFLPEKHTDFIFALVGEEMGLLGAGTVFLLYAFLLGRAFSLAFHSRDRRVMYSAFGIAILYAFHFVSNVGMTLGLIPVIGIPLPPLSYGGSSLITFFLAMGLLNNFYRHRDLV